MNTMRTILVAVVSAFLVACQAGPAGSATIPVQTQGAQTVGQDQGTASAAETGSANNTVSPALYNFIAAKTVRIARSPDGSEQIEVIGADDADVTIGNGAFGLIRFGDRAQEASVSSGGGAAGGTGGSTRMDSLEVIPPGARPSRGGNEVPTGQ